MTTASPVQTIRHWGTFANAGVLPGVGSANANLKVGDFAFVTSALLYTCTVNAYPAAGSTWVRVNAQIPTRVETTAVGALAATDIGGVVRASFAGAVNFSLPSLAAAAIGESMLILLQPENNATVLTVTPAGGVTVNNSGGPFAPNVTGPPGRLLLESADGLNWYA